MKRAVAPSFSVGHVAYAHDVRETATANVDRDLSDDNVTLIDRLQGRSIYEYTDERMQPYIDEYNAKQKRSDRKIKGTYTEYFQQQKDHGSLVYEAVCQYGEHEDLGKEYYSPSTSPERKAAIKEEFEGYYKHVLDELQRKYPHMEVLWATIHLDEPNGTPHMHIGYQPIGDRYKQGLSHQVSIGNALTCDGVERVQSRKESLDVGGYQIAKWYQQIRHEIMIPELERMGYEIKAEKHGLQHEPPSTFRESMELVDAERKTVKELSSKVIKAQDDLVAARKGFEADKEAAEAMLAKREADLQADVADKSEMLAKKEADLQARGETQAEKEVYLAQMEEFLNGENDELKAREIDVAAREARAADLDETISKLQRNKTFINLVKADNDTILDVPMSAAQARAIQQGLLDKQRLEDLEADLEVREDALAVRAESIDVAIQQGIEDGLPKEIAAIKKESLTLSAREARVANVEAYAEKLAQDKAAEMITDELQRTGTLKRITDSLANEFRARFMSGIEHYIDENSIQLKWDKRRGFEGVKGFDIIKEITSHYSQELRSSIDDFLKHFRKPGQFEHEQLVTETKGKIDNLYRALTGSRGHLKNYVLEALAEKVIKGDGAVISVTSDFIEGKFNEELGLNIGDNIEHGLHL